MGKTKREISRSEFTARLFASLRYAYESVANRSGITVRQLEIVISVKEHPGKIQAYHTKSLKMKSSNMCLQVRQLIDRGYLKFCLVGVPPRLNEIDRRTRGLFVDVRGNAIILDREGAWLEVLENQSPVIRAFVAMMKECPALMESAGG